VGWSKDEAKKENGLPREEKARWAPSLLTSFLMSFLFSLILRASKRREERGFKTFKVCFETLVLNLRWGWKTYKH
jgi:hypothetical protein